MSHRVVIVGGGFGGLCAARALRHAPVDVTLVDRRNFHLFQPLAYQVATGGLSPAEITAPLRAIFKRQANVRVLLAEVGDFDLERRAVVLRHLPSGREEVRLAYDTLIVAGGSRYSYFGHDEWRRHAPELKSLEGALDIRSRVLGAFEAAALEPDPVARERWMTFVVVGAGPTGVEMAGQIAELARETLRRDFRTLDARAVRVLLVEAGDRVLGEFPETLSHRAARALERLGVSPMVGHTVVGVGADEVGIRAPHGRIDWVGARTAVWAAGVRASSLAAALARAAGADVDSAGRVAVGPDLALAGYPEVFAVGDMARTATPLPGLAPVAMQQGRHAARVIHARLRGRESRPFQYHDKGNLATIGRSKAVARVGPLRVAGFPAWALWLSVHLAYLIGFQNRLLVLLRWTFSFATRGRGARLIAPKYSTPFTSGRLLGDDRT